MQYYPKQPRMYDGMRMLWRELDNATPEYRATIEEAYAKRTSLNGKVFDIRTDTWVSLPPKG